MTESGAQFSIAFRGEEGIYKAIEEKTKDTDAPTSPIGKERN